ncbi:hypothetical protein PR202_gn00112 [Eleusine coracana subsp. coracana]|uniref:Uncharacterized protein n=1 Tax=Eleusine coracana subsp. coracana TaxID=191504 RepID=A0AAV5FYR3_ELECO|nr:hypothetical protein PR202_gn00112 [Eleusine coracana subsp. coracana]
MCSCTSSSACRPAPSVASAPYAVPGPPPRRCRPFTVAARPAAVAKVSSTYFGLAVRFEVFGGRWRRGDGPFARAVALKSPYFSSYRVLGSWDGVLCLQPFTLLFLPITHTGEPARDDQIVL